MALFYLFIFFFGLIFGSFLNCLIWRLHTGESMWGRSHCPNCNHKIYWFDNIPVLSYLILLGKCRNCKKIISPQYPIIELITGFLFLLAAYMNLKMFGFNSPEGLFGFDLIANYKLFISILKDWFLISVMIIIFIYDLRWYLILDEITLPSIVLFFLINLFLGFGWQAMLIAGLIGGSFFLLQFLISKGKWIGGGDIRLGALMGVALGKMDLLFVAIMLAYFVGSIIGVGLIISGKKKWGSELPLGVFLSAAVIFSIFFGMRIAEWYFKGF